MRFPNVVGTSGCTPWKGRKAVSNGTTNFNRRSYRDKRVGDNSTMEGVAHNVVQRTETEREKRGTDMGTASEGPLDNGTGAVGGTLT